MRRISRLSAILVLAALALTASPSTKGQEYPGGAAVAQQAVPQAAPNTPSMEAPEARAPEEQAPAAPMDLEVEEVPQRTEVVAPPAGQDTPPIAETAPPVDKTTLPHDLSPWNMFASADIVVQAVMIGLVIASVITWTVWLAKTVELASAKRKTRRNLRDIANEPSLAAADAKLGKRRGVVRALIEAAEAELRLSANTPEKSGIKERVASSLEGIQIAAGRQMNVGTGMLATIGATAPFVGLFGTVWGIMNSFIGISKAQTTNLAVVAPGIAEALLATALGLAAAIPAVIIYNHFSRGIAGYKALVAEAAAMVNRLVSRDLDAAAGNRPRRVASAAE